MFKLWKISQHESDCSAIKYNLRQASPTTSSSFPLSFLHEFADWSIYVMTALKLYCIQAAFTFVEISCCMQFPELSWHWFLKLLFAILSHESCVKDWNVWKIPLTQKFPINHVVNHIAWVAFTVHVFGTNENYEKISAPKYEWSNQNETAEKRSTKLRKKTLHSRKRALNPYVQDVVLIIYCIHSFPTIIYKGNSAGRDENSLGKQKSL